MDPLISGPMSLGQYPKGGYDYNFSGNVQGFTCLLCQKVMRDPMQAGCGHHYCRSCIEDYIGTGATSCKLCNQMLNQSQIFPDASIRNRIMTLQVLCPNVRCTWVGTISAIDAHVHNCEYRSLNCEYCGELIEVLVLPQHMDNCRKQTVRCPLCREKVTSGMEQHKTICGKEYINCAFHCGSPAFLREDLAEHEDPFRTNCQNMQRSCPFEPCPHRSGLALLKQHLEVGTLQHALYYKMQVSSFRDEMSKMASKQEELEKENTSVRKQLLALQQSHYGTKMKLSSFIRTRVPPFPDESWDYFEEPVTISTDGVLHWQIVNFKSLANANRHTKIYSQPFFTSPSGFKLCCFVQKDDDQIVRLYIQRMKGKFDDILKNFILQTVVVIVMNIHRANNLTFKCQFDQLSGEIMGPLELATFHSLAKFIGDSSSMFMEVMPNVPID